MSKLFENFGVSSKKKPVVNYWSFRHMKYLRSTFLKYVFENLPFFYNSCLNNNNRFLSSSEKNSATVRCFHGAFESQINTTNVSIISLSSDFPHYILSLTCGPSCN